MQKYAKKEENENKIRCLNWETSESCGEAVGHVLQRLFTTQTLFSFSIFSITDPKFPQNFT